MIVWPSTAEPITSDVFATDRVPSIGSMSVTVAIASRTLSSTVTVATFSYVPARMSSDVTLWIAFTATLPPAGMLSMTA